MIWLEKVSTVTDMCNYSIVCRFSIWFFLLCGFLCISLVYASLKNLSKDYASLDHLTCTVRVLNFPFLCEESFVKYYRQIRSIFETVLHLTPVHNLFQVSLVLLFCQLNFMHTHERKMQNCEWTPALVTKPLAVSSVIKQELVLSDVTDSVAIDIKFNSCTWTYK